MKQKVIVIGDIGGHASVLDRILTNLELNDDFTLPPAVKVIQVGDLVRAQPQFREQNTRIMKTMHKVLTMNTSESWVQLLGNHESPILGGIPKPDWDVKAAFDNECISIIESLWQQGRVQLAASVGSTLVTHAGLTEGKWKQIGSPETATETAQILNTCSDLSDYEEPGMLVTGKVTKSADIIWAEINEELLEPWLNAELESPFNQVHGHASPYRWNTNSWWSNASNQVKEATLVLPNIRRSITTLKNGKTLTSVDWTLEDFNPPSLWPLLQI